MTAAPPTQRPRPAPGPQAGPEQRSRRPNSRRPRPRQHVPTEKPPIPKSRAGLQELTRRWPWLTLVASAAAVVALADLVEGTGDVRSMVRVVAAIVAAAAAVTASVVADRIELARPLPWRLQALASLGVMFSVMLADERDPRDLRFALGALVVVGLLLIAQVVATLWGSHWRARAWRLVLDAAILAMTFTLGVVTFLPGTRLADPVAVAAMAALVAGGYTAIVGARGQPHLGLRSPELYVVLSVILLGLYALGLAASVLGISVADRLAAPGLALASGLASIRAALLALPPSGPREPVAHREGTRLGLAPALAAALTILALSAVEIGGNGNTVGFFGVIALFGLIVARLVLTLLENRQLLGRIERSGVFEERLQELGHAFQTPMNQHEALAKVCQAMQATFGADAVVLWMLDHEGGELEAVEVTSSKRASILGRRMPLQDRTSLAARVARSREGECVANAMGAGLSNGFLTVLLRAQALLAVPILRGRTAQGVLVCVDSRNPTAYGAGELASAEILASQAAVALDSAYQQDLQRRRLEEVTALYRFGQSAHTKVSPSEITRELLPILKERLRYTYAAIWVRDRPNGMLRLIAADSPGGVPMAGSRPSQLATHAISANQPVHAGLGWAEASADYAPPRGGIRSQLAIPIAIGHMVLGVVDLESRQSNAYSLNDERLLVSLTNQAALAIHNLQLVGETRQVEALKELDRMKSDLLGTVSHELRTPLSSIKGYATTLLTHDRKLGREEQREFLEIIDSESDRLTELIENLLEVSRIEAGVLSIDPAPVRLGTTVREVVRKVQLSASKHELVLEWPPDEQDVSADIRRIHQVLQNLLTNAVKYSPEGGRIVVRGAFEGHALVVSIQDEGRGIPRHEVARIFDRFHRIQGEASQQVGGTGLGLAICKALVEAHGGRIWAESPGEGQGSTFLFSLPRGADADPNQLKGVREVGMAANPTAPGAFAPRQAAEGRIP